MRRSFLLIVPSLLILALFLTAPGGPKPSVEFTHGIASGDVTHNSAVLWTRVDQKAKLTIEVSTNPAFPKKGTLKETVSATADNDFTAKVVVAPSELPVGVVTSLCGVPFFLYLLKKEKGDYGL